MIFQIILSDSRSFLGDACFDTFHNVAPPFLHKLAVIGPTMLGFLHHVYSASTSCWGSSIMCTVLPHPVGVPPPCVQYFHILLGFLHHVYSSSTSCWVPPSCVQYFHILLGFLHHVYSTSTSSWGSSTMCTVLPHPAGVPPSCVQYFHILLGFLHHVYSTSTSCRGSFTMCTVLPHPAGIPSLSVQYFHILQGFLFCGVQCPNTGHFDTYSYSLGALSTGAPIDEMPFTYLEL